MNRKIRSLGTPSYSFSAGFWLKNRLSHEKFKLLESATVPSSAALHL